MAGKKNVTEKLQLIIDVVREHPEGIHLSEVARVAKMSKTMVGWYVNKRNPELFSVTEELGTKKKSIIKKIKLKGEN